MASGSWLKRIIIGLIAAIAALFVTKKKVAAPGARSESEFKLPPVPDARASGPEDATPLTEEEQAMMASRAPEFKGYSAPTPEAVDAPEAPGPEEATPLTEDERAAFARRQGIAGSDDAPPLPPISYEIAKANADEAEKLRETGDTDGAAAREQRMYFGGSVTDPAAPPPSVTQEIASANADDADAPDQYTSAGATVQEAGVTEHAVGDSTPEPTSEAFDVDFFSC